MAEQEMGAVETMIRVTGEACLLGPASNSECAIWAGSLLAGPFSLNSCKWATPGKQDWRCGMNQTLG